MCFDEIKSTGMINVPIKANTDETVVTIKEISVTKETPGTLHLNNKKDTLKVRIFPLKTPMFECTHPFSKLPPMLSQV